MAAPLKSRLGDFDCVLLSLYASNVPRADGPDLGAGRYRRRAREGGGCSVLTALVTIRSINGGAGYNSFLARASPPARVTVYHNVLRPEPHFYLFKFPSK